MRTVNRERRTGERDASGHVDRHVARDGERGFPERLGMGHRDRALFEDRAARPAVALQEDQLAASAFREDARQVCVPAAVRAVRQDTVHDQLAALLDVKHAVGVAVVEVRVTREEHVAWRRARVDGHAAFERRVALAVGNRVAVARRPNHIGAGHLKWANRGVAEAARRRRNGRLLVVERRPLAQVERQIRRRTAVIAEETTSLANPQLSIVHDPPCRRGDRAHAT